MRKDAFSRRRFLRGAGGITVGLPFLESLAPRQAAAADAAKRLVLWNFPEGIVASAWQPAAGSDRTRFEFAPSMAPLAPFKDDLIVTRGIDSTSCKDEGSNHKSSMVHVFTAGTGTSVDQVIAQRIGKSYRLASLELGAKVKAQAVGYRSIYSAGKPVPCVNDPKETFARLFTGGSLPNGKGQTVDDAALGQLFARRKSVIDVVKGQFDALTKELGGDDRMRIDAHLSAIREAEKELLAAGGGGSGGAACKTPELAFPDKLDLQQTGKLQMDLMVLALACGLTPVASLQYSQTGCPEKFEFINSNSVSDVLHGWVHNDKGNPAYTEMWKSCLTWFAGQFAYLLDKMKQVNEGPRTLLDNSAVLMTSSFGHAGQHSPSNLPFVIAGKAGGVLKTGQFLDYSQQKPAHNRLLLGLCRAFGVEMSAFGNPKYGTEPLGELFA